MLHVHEEGHSEDGEDEHDEEEQEADVEERRHRHGQREEEGADAPGALDQAEDAADLGHADHPEQRGGDEVRLDQVAQYDACKENRQECCMYRT